MLLINPLVQPPHPPCPPQLQQPTVNPTNSPAAARPCCMQADRSAPSSPCETAGCRALVGGLPGRV